VRQGLELEETVVARLDAAARRLETMAREAAEPAGQHPVRSESTA
jgi:hypothetical protein